MSEFYDGNYEKDSGDISPQVIPQSNESNTQYTSSKVKKKKKVNGWAVGCISLAVILCLGTSFVAGYFVSDRAASPDFTDVWNNTSDTSETNKKEEATFYHAVPVETVIDENSIAGVATKVAASVVEISTESVQMGSYFQQYIASGAGSGVIIGNNDTHFYIITNNHVISGADTITVRTNDGVEYSAAVVGSDSESDVALLKIEATGLTVAVIGNSDSISVGEEVVAIGNPLGKLGGTVTNGIISALGREVNIEGENMTLLQTNAAVNPGNSGGGLFNMRGELIGIINAKSSGSNIEGLGFAIPINEADEVVKQLLEYGYVRGRVDLGLSTIEITSSTMAYYYRVSSLGVYITGSKYNEELKPGDRILTLGGTEITSLADCKSVLSDYEVGDTIEMVVVRGGKTLTVDVVCYEQIPDESINFQTN